MVARYFKSEYTLRFVVSEDLIQYEVVDKILSVLKDATRRKILSILKENRMTAENIRESIDITRPGLEKHLKQMLEIGIIERKAEMYPNLRYVYFLPDSANELLENLLEIFKQYRASLRDELMNSLDKQDQLYVLGASTKENYEATKAHLKAMLKMVERKEQD
ncbi:MAG: ArsR/SmtB family transcription factor [Candidatus Hodarchaeota archaeon]